MITPTVQVSPRTVVEAFLPQRGAVSLRDLLDTANAVGIDDQPVRLAVRRMIAAGEVVQEGRGRQGQIRLTTSGRDALALDRLALGLAFAQDKGRMPWDGRWHLISATIPESQRALRDRLRRDLRALGAAPLSTSLHLSAHDLSALVTPDLREHLVLAAATELTVHGTADPHQIAALLWPAEPVLAGYSALGETLHWAQQALDDGRDAVIVQLFLAEALEQAMRSDPLLPAELRQGTWSPIDARGEWRRLWQRASAAPRGDLVYRGWLGLD